MTRNDSLTTQLTGTRCPSTATLSLKQFRPMSRTATINRPQPTRVSRNRGRVQMSDRHFGLIPKLLPA